MAIYPCAANGDRPTNWRRAGQLFRGKTCCVPRNVSRIGPPANICVSRYRKRLQNYLLHRRQGTAGRDGRLAGRVPRGTKALAGSDDPSRRVTGVRRANAITQRDDAATAHRAAVPAALGIPFSKNHGVRARERLGDCAGFPKSTPKPLNRRQAKSRWTSTAGRLVADAIKQARKASFRERFGYLFP